MEYYVYDGGELIDVITIDDEDLFMAENPHLRLEKCEENLSFLEDDDDYYYDD